MEAWRDYALNTSVLSGRAAACDRPPSLRRQEVQDIRSPPRPPSATSAIVGQSERAQPKLSSQWEKWGK